MMTLTTKMMILKSKNTAPYFYKGRCLFNEAMLQFQVWRVCVAMGLRFSFLNAAILA